MYLFIYFWYVGCSLLRAGFLWLRRAGATLRCGARASHCGGFSCCGARALGTWASVVTALRLSSCGMRAPECASFSSCGSWALEHRLSSCSARAELLRGMWDPPGPGIKPVSPALAGGLLTTAPPGKPSTTVLKMLIIVILNSIFDNYNIYVISESNSDALSIQTVFV